MSPEDKARILNESFEAIARVEQTLREPRSFQIDDVPRAHFDPVRRRRQMREPVQKDAEAEVMFSEPILTRAAPAADDGGWWAAIDQRIASAIEAERETLCAIVAEALGGALKDSERKSSRALQAELGALRAEVAKLESLFEVLRIASERERSQVLDLPAWPSRRDMN